jgi:hypothetical protein
MAQLGSTSSVPRHRFDTNNQLIDDFAWKFNKHDVKVGVDFHRTSVNQFFDKYFRGKLTFGSLADFLSGTVDGGFQYSGDSQRRTHENNFGLYVQDSYRVTPRLTLNYGLRWDYFGVIQEKNNLLSNVTSLDLAGSSFTLTQVGQPGLKNLYNPDKKDFAPRVSVAWDVTGKGKTVIRAGYGIFFDAFSQDMVLGHLPYSPFYDPGPAYNNIPYTKGTAPDIIATPAIKTADSGLPIGAGVPVFSNDPANACLPECDAFAFDRNIKTPYMENYNLNLQQQISNKIVVQVGYVGSQGHRLWRFFDLSQPSQAEITASDCPNGIATCATTSAITGSYGVPRDYIGGNFPYGAFYLLQENSTGKSNYNALQTSFRVNAWRGVSSTVNFVWSRSMDNSSDGEDFEPNAAQPNDSHNPQLEYGPSNFNIKRRLTWNFAYDFPTMGGNWKRLKNGWGLNSVLSVQDGQPFHFNYNFEDDFSGSGSGFDRPDVVGPIVYHPHDPLNFVDLSAFAIPCTVTAATGSAQDCIPGTRHLGNMRRGSLVGPSYKQWDFAIYKNTSITERLRMQFRADFFNIINHPNFASPYLPAFLADPGINGFTLDSTGTREVGVPHSPTCACSGVVTATGDVGIGNPFLGGGGPRGIQLAVKFTF